MALIPHPGTTHGSAAPQQQDVDPGILLRRPLFTQGRRPYVQVAMAPVPVHAEPVAVIPVPILLGVALSGDQGVAVVAGSAGSQSQVVTVNDQVNGWRVVAIGRDSVTFRSASSDATAHLKTPDGEPPASLHPRAAPPRRAQTNAISISAKPSPADCWALSRRPSQIFAEIDEATYGTAIAMQAACNLQRVARR